MTADQVTQLLQQQADILSVLLDIFSLAKLVVFALGVVAGALLADV